MANEPKTPGRVAWEAYRSALVKTPDQPAAGGYTSPAWEAAAQAVRKQTLDEIQAKLIAEEAYYTKHHAGWVNDYEILTDVIRIADAPIRVDPDEPTPEEAEACAEDAAAAPSKSPPPAER